MDIRKELDVSDIQIEDITSDTDWNSNNHINIGGKSTLQKKRLRELVNDIDSLVSKLNHPFCILLLKIYFKCHWFIFNIRIICIFIFNLFINNKFTIWKVCKGKSLKRGLSIVMSSTLVLGHWCSGWSLRNQQRLIRKVVNEQGGWQLYKVSALSKLIFNKKHHYKQYEQEKTFLTIKKANRGTGILYFWKQHVWLLKYRIIKYSSRYFFLYHRFSAFWLRSKCTWN
jgi:hypothetical protein